MAKEAELREARETLQDAVESLTLGFALYDTEARLMMCNQRYREFNFMSADMLVPGTRWIDFIRTGAERGQYLGAEGRVEAWLAERRELRQQRSEEHTSELQSLMRISYAVFCLKKKKDTHKNI